MSKILVFLQQEGGKLNTASLSALAAAQEIGSQSASEVVGFCWGASAETAAKSAANRGLSKVLFADSSDPHAAYSLTVADAITQAAKAAGANVVVGASTSLGKDALPAVAALLDAGMASDILSVIDAQTFARPMYAGNVIAKVIVESAVKVISVRATAFPQAAESATAATVEALSIQPSSLPKAEIVNFASSATGRPELGDAKIVVSGGRGVQSKEGFEKFIYPLADALGAAIGASRAAVDAGFAPNDWQVGQTGKTVAPQLYIAVGISGAIQHLAGTKDAKVVVAINKDAEAPIFDVADYGLVADITTAVPELIELVKK